MDSLSSVLVPYLLPFISIVHTLFEILYGHPPRHSHFGIDPEHDCVIPELVGWLQRHHRCSINSYSSSTTYYSMTSVTNIVHNANLQWTIIDRVWLKLQPCAQSSVTSRVCHNLSYLYFGPYEIQSISGQVAYKLKMAPHAPLFTLCSMSLPW